MRGDAATEPLARRLLAEVCARSESFARLHDDPKLKDVKVFATDQILAMIMAAPRSAFSWDLVVNRVGNKLFLDKVCIDQVKEPVIERV